MLFSGWYKWFDEAVRVYFVGNGVVALDLQTTPSRPQSGAGGLMTVVVDCQQKCGASVEPARLREQDRFVFCLCDWRHHGGANRRVLEGCMT